MTPAAAEIDAYVSAFAVAGVDRSTPEPAWLHALRRKSMTRFEALGLPTGREESWRQTPVAPVVATPFRPARPGAAFAADRLPGGPSLPFRSTTRLVFVDGGFESALSAVPPPDSGFFAGSLASALREIPSAMEPLLGRIGNAETRPFVALNAAFFADAAVVRIPAGLSLDEPVHVVHVAARRGEAEMTCLRTLVVAEPGSRATVVESFLSADGRPGLTNAVAEVEIAEGASIDHVRFQSEGATDLHLGTLDARLGRDGRFASHAISIGARWARVEIGVTLAGTGAECFLNGMYVADGARHVDHRTSVDHAVPHGASHQLYKGLLGGASRAVFHGRILVREDAQKTDAFQSNKNLLLSGDALVFTRPQLEIHANDVKCTHGATIGRLDPEALFYLRSRGVGVEEARGVLIRAFTGEVLQRIPAAEVREGIEVEVASRVPVESDWGGIA